MYVVVWIGLNTPVDLNSVHSVRLPERQRLADLTTFYCNYFSDMNKSVPALLMPI